MLEGLSSPAAVVIALLTYTDWWQPVSASVLTVGNAKHGRQLGDGIPSGLLGRLDEREELRLRMRLLDGLDRRLLYLWYVKQLPAHEIARELHISRRHCFRRRAAAIRRLVEFGGGEGEDGSFPEQAEPARSG